MRRLKLNEQILRQIESALDERKNGRRGPAQLRDFPGERRTGGLGRRHIDRAAPEPGPEGASTGQRDS